MHVYVQHFFSRLAHTHVNTHIRAHVLFAYAYICVYTHPMHASKSVYVCPNEHAIYSCAHVYAVSHMYTYTCLHTL